MTIIEAIKKGWGNHDHSGYFSIQHGMMDERVIVHVDDHHGVLDVESFDGRNISLTSNDILADDWICIERGEST